MNSQFIVFDFDGTVGQTFPLLMNAFRTAMAVKKYPVPTVEECEALRGQDIKSIRETLGLNWIQMSQIIFMVQSEMRKEFHRIEPVEGIDVVLNDFKQDVPLGLMTSNESSRIEAWLKQYEMYDLIDHVSHDREFFAKSKQLWRLIKASNIAPSDTVLVCDEVRDIQAARQVGMACVAVGWGHQPLERLEVEKPDALVETIEDLKNVLSSL